MSNINDGVIEIMHISENLKKFRIARSLTQEELASYLLITPQSVSKWERGESYPDITFLPALSSILEVSIDEIVGMDLIRSEETRKSIHKAANEFMRNQNYAQAEKVYRNALKTYPNRADFMLGLADTLTLQGKDDEAIRLTESGLKLSAGDKQKATARAVLCFLYLRCKKPDKAAALASTLPHTRESREAIQPQIVKGLDENELNRIVQNLILGESIMQAE